MPLNIALALQDIQHAAGRRIFKFNFYTNVTLQEILLFLFGVSDTDFLQTPQAGNQSNVPQSSHKETHSQQLPKVLRLHYRGSLWYQQCLEFSHHQKNAYAYTTP